MNYLPELREAMVDAARRHYQPDAVTPATGRCRPSRFRRVPGGRPLALIGALVLGGTSGAIATAATKVAHPLAVSAAAVRAGARPVPRARPVTWRKPVASPEPVTWATHVAGVAPPARARAVSRAAPVGGVGVVTGARPVPGGEPFTSARAGGGSGVVTGARPVPRGEPFTSARPGGGAISVAHAETVPKRLARAKPVSAAAVAPSAA